MLQCVHLACWCISLVGAFCNVCIFLAGTLCNVCIKYQLGGIAQQSSFLNVQAGRNLNNAASYLRDPYRGDDFERGSIGGMRSDAAYGRTQRVRAYDGLLDDSLREDDRGRTNSYNRQGRQSGRNSRDMYRQ